MNLGARTFFLFAILAFAFALNAAAPKVTHLPQPPKAGESVRITARLKGPATTNAVILQYQLIDPGRYIALADSAFKTNWNSVPMSELAREGASNERLFSADLPGALQVNRRLVRYRIAIGETIVAPDAESSVPNYAYFVYDGVPAWRAAINPKSGDAKLRQVVTFGTNVMRSLPVYQFISKKAAVENTTWYEQAEFGNDAARKKYNYTGTFVADDGKVYDHVRFRARGGQWRYAMGKNMWKFDFNRGEHLQTRDDFGEKYKSKWEKLNLGACIQQGTSHRRGEHGMFEAVAFKLFDLVGVEAPRTHWVHFRIIDSPEENPASQYDGDFWGLYLATENIDDAFLKEHDLPAGNLYKMDFGQPDLHSHTKFAQPNNADVRQFMAASRTARDESWWRANVDLPRYYSYRSIVECIHHYDIYNGKNYFYYHNPETQRWSVLPWDVDLTWSDRMHGSGQEPFYRAGILSRPPFSIEYQNRLREIRDLLFNPEAMSALIEEYAATISAPNGGMSLVDADRAKWDYHPVMASRLIDPRKTAPGQFYDGAATRDFRGMVQLMKDYVRTRGAWVDSALLADHAIPPAPTIAVNELANAVGKAPRVHASVRKTTGDIQFEWRLAEVTPASAWQPRVPRKHEITALWQTNGTESIQIPEKLLRAGATGATYRVRARVQDASGRSSHWSAPWEWMQR